MLTAILEDPATMLCLICQHETAPERALAIGAKATQILHCPHCLGELRDTPEGEVGTVTDQRRAAVRRKTREVFVDRMARSGPVACPLCQNTLAAEDVALIKERDSYHCGACTRDIVAYAYRQDAYGEERWLPVIYALDELCHDARCSGCSALGAIAQTCQLALSEIARNHPQSSRQLSAILAREDWHPPHDDCALSCVAIKQYLSTAGDHTLLV